MLGRYVRVVVVGIEGEINLGFIARLVKNFEADDLYLVSPIAKITEEARRFAAKGVDVLEKTVIVNTLKEALKGIDLSACTSAKIGEEKDVLRHPITPWEFAELALKRNRIAVVFGRESVGLTREELSQCDLMVTIPGNPEYPVMNLSHAVAVILYELYKVFSSHRGFKYEAPNRNILDKIMEYFNNIVNEVELDERRKHKITTSFRRLIFKSNIDKAEAYNVLYIMRKIYVKLAGRDHGNTSND